MRKSILWTLLLQAVTFVVSFAGSMIIARLLSPNEMGVYAIAVAAIGVTQVFAVFGLSSYIVRDSDLQSSTLDLAFSINALLAIVLSVALAVISLFSQTILGDARAGEVMRVLMFIPLINMFSFRQSSMLQREMRFVAGSIITATMAFTMWFLSVAFAWGGASYMSAAYASIASSIVGVIGYTVAAPHHFAFRITFKGWRRLTRFGLEIMSISGISLLAARLSEVVLGRLLGITALGFYSRATTLANLMFEHVYGTATRIAFSKLARDFREIGDLRTPFLQALTLILAVMWPLEIGLAILAKPAIVIIFGNAWLPAAPALSILLIAQAITLSFGMNWELFVLRDETTKQSRLEVKRALFGFFIFSVFCRFGLASAALGRVGDAIAGYFIYRGHVRRLANVRGAELRRVFMMSSILTVFAAIPPLIMMVIYDWSDSPPAFALVGSVGLGIVAWFAAIHSLRHPLLDEFARVASKLSPRLAAAMQRRSEGL
ncbi:oligosaccharide flippase family protein (plasmid) [Sphingomonas sp. NY01]|uniref:oligosaccharide flippase family protein n=1 Tax=Sphingomonas sp. NY01 TaxID=2968057 RepID=UPI00315D5689